MPCIKPPHREAYKFNRMIKSNKILPIAFYAWDRFEWSGVTKTDRVILGQRKQLHKKEIQDR